MPAEAVTQSLILDARTRAGWVDERPQLSDAQLSELMALIGARVLLDRKGAIRRFISHIFAKAVEDSVLLFRLRTDLVMNKGHRSRSKLTTALSKEIAVLVAGDTVSSKMPASVSDGLRRALAAAQFLERGLPSPAAAAREVDAIVGTALTAKSVTPQLRHLLDDLRIAIKTGRDSSIQRQMIRGLAALLVDATGECPGRSYVSSERSLSRVGEHGWFHKLCRRLAEFVNEHEMIPDAMRLKRLPSLDGLVNQELRALRAEGKARAA